MFQAHDLIMSLIPQVKPVVKYNAPFFDYLGHYFCYLSKHKNKNSPIYISFISKGHDMQSDILQVENLKLVSKVYIPDEQTLHSDALAEFIIHAAIEHERKFASSKL